MKKQLISPRRLQEISTEAAFKLITAGTEARKPQPGEKADDLIKSIVNQTVITDEVRAARLAEAESFPDYIEPAAVPDVISYDGGKEPAPLADEVMDNIRDQFLSLIQEKTAKMPVARQIDELRTAPADPPKDVFFFAHGLAEAAGWDRAAVQNWLNYLDFIKYDYMGIGMKNMISLLPSIVETVRVIERNNAGLSTEARTALVKRKLDQKTLNAIDRATTAGNRAQRRIQKSSTYAKFRKRV